MVKFRGRSRPAEDGAEESEGSEGQGQGQRPPRNRIPEQSPERGATCRSLPERDSRRREGLRKLRASAEFTASPSGGNFEGQKGKKKKDDVLENDYELRIEDLTVDELLRIDLEEPLDSSTTAEPHVKLGILKGLNYRVWAQDHRRFLEGRGIWCIVSGDLPRPNRSVSQARRWAMVDAWIQSLIFGDVDPEQKKNMAKHSTSKGMWDSLKRVHGVSKKGRLPSMLLRLHSYIKSSNQTIIQMTADLWRLRNQISDLNPGSAPDDITMAAIVINACKGKEFDQAKYYLSMNDDLTLDMAVGHLRNVEQDKQYKNTSLLARNGCGRGDRKDQPGKAFKKDMREVQCYRCYRMGHIMRDCPLRKPAHKDSNNRAENSKESKNRPRDSTSSKGRRREHANYVR